MLSFAVALIAGAVIGRYWPESAHFVWLVWLLCLVVLMAPRKKGEDCANFSNPHPYAEYETLFTARPGRLAGLGMGKIVLAVCLALVAVGVYRQTHWNVSLEADRSALAENSLIQATLIALAPPVNVESGNTRWRTSARLIAIDGKPTRIHVLLSGPGDISFRRGDLIRAKVRVWSRMPPAYPGAFDLSGRLEREGLAASLSVARSGRSNKTASTFEIIPLETQSAILLILRLLDAVRAAAIDKTLAYGRDETGSLLAAMLYGYRENMDVETRDIFRRVGIGHVLAISGLHVGLVVALLWWCSGWLGWHSRFRAALCLVLALAYLALSGGGVAATRATVMVAAFLLGIMMGRKSDTMNSLGLAAFLLTLANPSAPVDVSFQLSFTAVVFIHFALGKPPLTEEKEWRKKERPKVGGILRRRTLKRLGGEAASLVKINLATWFGLFPIIMMVFNQINLIGLGINLIILPLMSIVLAGGLLLPWLGWIPGAAWLLTLPTKIIISIAAAADRIPFSSFPSHAPNAFLAALFYILFASLMVRNLIADARIRKTVVRIICGLLALVVAGMFYSARSAAPPAGGRLSALPSWNQDVALSESSDGDMVLWGNISRDGLREANWLHYLKRGGEVTIVSFMPGKTVADFPALQYHNGVKAVLSLSEDGGETTRIPVKSRVWTKLAGVGGIEYAVSRNSAGKVIWLALRTPDSSMTVASWLTPRQFTARMENCIPGSDADLLSLGLRTKNIPVVVAGSVMAVRSQTAPLPEIYVQRDRYGVMLVENGTVRGFDGIKWLTLAAPRASQAFLRNRE